MSDRVNEIIQQIRCLTGLEVTIMDTKFFSICYVKTAQGSLRSVAIGNDEPDLYRQLRVALNFIEHIKRA